MRAARIVGHHAHLLLADHEAAVILGVIDRALIDHAEIARGVVGAEELVAAMDFVDILPAASVDRLEESMLANVGEDRIPVQGVLEIAHRAFGGVAGQLLVGQDHCRRHGNAQPGG